MCLACAEVPAGGHGVYGEFLRRLRRSFVVSAVVLSVAAVGNVVAVQPAAAAAAKGDIVFLVDESGSMADDQARIRSQIGSVADQLAARGIDVQFGLIGYTNTQRVYSTLTSDL